MSTPLRQSTAVTVAVGPAIDSSNGDDEETALSLAASDVKLSKAGGTLAAKNDTGAPAHLGNGFYDVDLNVTDTNTLGELIVYIHVTGALYAMRVFHVIPALTYDALYGASAAAFDANQRVKADAVLISGSSATADYIEANIANLDTLTTLKNASRNNNLLDYLKALMLVAEHRGGAHTHQGNVFFVDPVNGDTHASGNRGGLSDPYAGIQDCHDNAVTDSNHDLIILISGNGAGPTTLTETITISKRYLSIHGPGRDFKITRSGDGDTITVTGGGVQLSGFQLETDTVGTGRGVYANTVDFLRVRHVWINATRGDGIAIRNSNNCIVEHCHFQDTGASGSGNGMSVEATDGNNADDVNINDNVFHKVQGDAIRLNANTTGVVAEALIRRNVFNDNQGYAVNIMNSGVDDAMLSDNRYANNASGNVTDSGTNTAQIGSNNGEFELADVSARIPAALSSNGNMKADIQEVNGNLQAAIKLAAAADQMLIVTVDDSTYSPTINDFEVTGVTDTDPNFYSEAMALFMTGNLAGQRRAIIGYSYGTKAKITISPSTQAPANGDIIYII